MLSSVSRTLTYFTAAAFGLVGVVLFVAPGWASANFAWQVSPFVAMTMGGWYTGAAAMAYEAAHRWRWSTVYSLLIFVWAFGLIEGLLLVIHSDVLRFDTALALVYMTMLLVAAISTVVGVSSYLRVRPAMHEDGPTNPWWSRAMFVFFLVYVSGLVVLLADGIAPDGKIWPGPLSLLTARAFAAFFGSLVLGAIPLAFARSLTPVLAYMRPGLFLAAIIEVAALINIGRFDFVNKPGGLLYHVSYIAAVLAALLLLMYGGMVRRRAHKRIAASGVTP